MIFSDVLLVFLVTCAACSNAANTWSGLRSPANIISSACCLSAMSRLSRGFLPSLSSACADCLCILWTCTIGSADLSKSVCARSLLFANAPLAPGALALNVLTAGYAFKPNRPTFEMARPTNFSPL